MLSQNLYQNIHIIEGCLQAGAQACVYCGSHSRDHCLEYLIFKFPKFKIFKYIYMKKSFITSY